MAKKRPAPSPGQSDASRSAAAGSDDSRPATLPLRKFESAVEEIELIVGRLESGQLDLGDSLEQYAKGIETLQECHRLLAAAERRVTLLSGFDADGNPVEAAFDTSAFVAGEGGRSMASGPEGRDRDSEASVLDSDLE
ncbi:MAG: exodeoxyribonuclease VII small subunit [Planctomycetaceae bacterium]|nr:MAG: exodeoxyribonuclease VII small subunit [Planctomycetaceae bacterium]